MINYRYNSSVHARKDGIRPIATSRESVFIASVIVLYLHFDDIDGESARFGTNGQDTELARSSHSLLKSDCERW